MMEPVYSANTAPTPPAVKVIVQEKSAVVAEVAVGVVSTQDSPLLAAKVTRPSAGGLGEAMMEAVKVTGWPPIDGSGMSPVMLIAVPIPVRCSTTRLLSGWPTASWLRAAS